MPKDNNNQVSISNTQTVTPVAPVTDDLPITSNLPPNTSTGSAAPSDDIVMPPIITAPSPKKKFAGGRIIATILGLFLLVGGVGAGIVLVRQNQNPQEKAAEGCGGIPGLEFLCGTGVAELEQTPNLPSGYTSSCSESTGRCSISGPGCTSGICGEYRIVGSGGGGDCRNVKIDCPPGTVVDYTKPKDTFCFDENGYGLCNWPYSIGSAQQASGCCSNIRIDPDTGEETCRNKEFTTYECVPTSTPTPPAITASCQDVKAYSSTWTLLTNAQLAQLDAGGSVNFCVAGSATGGSFNKAKFTINGVVQPETTTVRPSSTDFCQSYMIPAGVTAFNVSAQINHVTLGWK